MLERERASSGADPRGEVLVLGLREFVESEGAHLNRCPRGAGKLVVVRRDPFGDLGNSLRMMH